MVITRWRRRYPSSLPVIFSGAAGSSRTIYVTKESAMARIAIWTASHLPKLGGLEWSTYRLLRALARWGHEPLFITRATDGIAPSDVPEVRFAGATIKEWTRISGDWILANRG